MRTPVGGHVVGFPLRSKFRKGPGCFFCMCFFKHGLRVGLHRSGRTMIFARGAKQRHEQMLVKLGVVPRIFGGSLQIFRRAAGLRRVRSQATIMFRHAAPHHLRSPYWRKALNLPIMAALPNVQAATYAIASNICSHTKKF